jgi:hypothetical protein
MIEDNVPLTEEDKKAMFVDIPLIEGEDDGTAKVSCSRKINVDLGQYDMAVLLFEK